MILEGLEGDSGQLAARTGGKVKPEGACKGDLCVPLPDGPLDARVLSERLGMPLVAAERRGLGALARGWGGGALRVRGGGWARADERADARPRAARSPRPPVLAALAARDADRDGRLGIVVRVP